MVYQKGVITIKNNRDQHKREGLIRLSLFIVLVPLVFIDTHTYYKGFIAVVALYSLVTGAIRLLKHKRL